MLQILYYVPSWQRYVLFNVYVKLTLINVNKKRRQLINIVLYQKIMRIMTINELL